MLAQREPTFLLCAAFSPRDAHKSWLACVLDAYPLHIVILIYCHALFIYRQADVRGTT